MTLQTKNGTYRSVYFSPEKHSGFSSKYESSSPRLRFQSKFQLKRNKKSNQDEIHINKRSKLEDPQESEVTFDIKVESEEKCKPGITAVSDVLQGDANAVINVCGRITLHSAEEPDHGILSEGGLRKQEAVFSHNFGTVRLVLWESDITRVKSVYDISKIIVREFDNAKYLTLNKQSTIIKLADTSIDRMDTEADGLPHSQKVHCPAEDVLSV
jgi:hypothetical protein